MPHRQGYIRIDIPPGLAIEEVGLDELPEWDSASMLAPRKFGDQWYDQRRTPVLMVPSVVVRPERNVLINQEHPDFARITASEVQPVRWDSRLWT